MKLWFVVDSFQHDAFNITTSTSAEMKESYLIQNVDGLCPDSAIWNSDIWFNNFVIMQFVYTCIICIIMLQYTLNTLTSMARRALVWPLSKQTHIVCVRSLNEYNQNAGERYIYENMLIVEYADEIG